MENKIQPISKSKVVDYSDRPLQNFWRQKAGKTSSSKSHREQITEILQSVEEGIVCIQTEALADKKLIEQIFTTAQGRKVKIYILVNDYSQGLDQLNEICLIRFGGLQNIGSLILVNPNSNNPSGIFFGGQLTEGSIAVSEHISRELDKKEIPDLFRHFCFHFWETVKKEVIEKGKQTDVVSKPLDIFHDVNAFDGKDFVYGTLFDFVETANRGEMSGKLIVPLGKESLLPIKIKPTDEVNLSVNVSVSLLPKDEFEKQTPKFTDDGVTVEIKYSWQNVPFYLPEKCDVNSLYKRWQDEIERIKKHLDSIIEKIDAAEKKEATISKKISRFFLGKKTIFGKLKSDIEGLKTVDFANISESSVKEKINRINEIYKEVEKEVGEIEQEDKKAKLDEEIENLNKQISEEETKLDNAKQELKDKKQVIQQKIEEFCQKHEIEQSKLNFEKGKWEQQTSNKNKKNNPKEAEVAEKKLNELKEIQNSGFVSKTESEVSDLERRIKSLKSQIENKEREKSKQVSQNQSDSSLNMLVGNKNQSNQSSNQKSLLEVSNLPQLPKVGQLYQLNSHPYLAIEFWEQYEQGKSEAERLKAKLCAIK